jgi:hypothetical protein
LCLSWARSIQSIPFHPISLRSILILSTHLRQPYSVKKLLLRNSKKWKPDGVIPRNGQIWHNLLRKDVAQKELCYQWWWWWFFENPMVVFINTT